MKHRLVLYKVKPEAVAENRRLIEAVFKELPARAPEGLSYMVIELEDGNFVHLKSDAARARLSWAGCRPSRPIGAASASAAKCRRSHTRAG